MFRPWNRPMKASTARSIGVPKIMAPASASWPGVAIGTCPKAECAALAPDLFQRLLGHEFGDLIQADFGAFNFARSFHYRLGHTVDVAVHAVKEYLNPHAHGRFLTYSNKLPQPRTSTTPHNSPTGASATSAQIGRA